MHQEVGELLVRRGLLTREQLERARDAKRQAGGTLLTNLIELGIVSEDRLYAFLSQCLQLPLVSPDALETIEPEVITYVPRDIAERHRVVPLGLDGRELQLCLADPDRLEDLDDLGRTLGRPLRPVLVTETGLNDALDRYYAIRPEIRFSQAVPAKPPPAQVARTVTQQIERTGLFKMPTSLTEAPAAAAEPRLDPVDMLAAAMSGDDVVRATFRFFVEFFAEVAILGVHKGQALVVLAGNRSGPRALPGPIEMPLEEGSVLWAVLARPQVAHRPRIEDQSFLGLCWAVKLPPVDVTVVPVFDNGRPIFLVVGQGREEKQVKQKFPEMKAFLTKVSQALRIVALRKDIRGDRADPGRQANSR